LARLKVFSISGEFGTWNVRAISREKALDELSAFFRRQDRAEKKRVLKETCDIASAVRIPRRFF